MAARSRLKSAGGTSSLIVVAVVLALVVWGAVDEYRDLAFRDRAARVLTAGRPGGGVAAFLKSEALEHSWVPAEGAYYATRRRRSPLHVLGRRDTQLKAYLDAAGNVNRVDLRDVATGP